MATSRAGVPDPKAAATEVLLEAAARAVGAHRAYLLPPGVPAPRPRRSGLLRRDEAHPLTVEIPDEHPPRRLVLELPRPPTPEDGLVARALVRVFEPVRAPARPEPAGRPPSTDLLDALARAMDEGPGALLGAVLEPVGVRAGGLAEVGGRTWTLGQGRPVLRKAARRALDEDGSCEIRGRHFRLFRLERGGEVVGGLAAESPADDAPLAAAVRILTEALGPAGPAPGPAPVAEPSEDLATALAVLPIPAILLDPSGRLEGASPEAERLFQLTEFDVGTQVAHRLGDLRADRVLAGTDLPEKVLVDERWYEPACAVLASGSRLFVLLDRSHQQDLDRSRDELVAAMAHELRTPIAGVRALLEVLRISGGKIPAERASGMVGEGVREVGRLERLVEDLILTARAATGGVVAHPGEIALRPVADEVVRHARERYPDRGFEVEGEARAMADPALVRHAVWHLVDNAAKFAEAGDAVRVEIEENPKGAEIRVIDDGPGIFSGDLPDLFRPFHRLDRNTAAPHGGAGIGLYLVKTVLEAQGGEVWARSRLGKGSIFTFRLPRAA